MEEKDSKNTQSATKTALSTLKTFCGEKYPNKVQNFEEIAKEELNVFLVDFYPNARKNRRKLQEDSTNKHSLWPATILKLEKEKLSKVSLMC